MTRLVAITLALALVSAPGLARAQDAGTSPPGRSVDLEQGTPAPYTGALVDKERIGAILAKRVAAELEARALQLQVQEAASKRQDAENRAAAAESRPNIGVIIGATGGALVLGIVTGLVLGLVTFKK